MTAPQQTSASPQSEPPAAPTRRRTAFGALAATLGVVLATGLISPIAPTAQAAVVDSPITASSETARLELSPIGSYDTGVFDQSAAEIVTYHAASQRLFVVNAAAGAIDVLSIEDPANPVKLTSLAAEGVVTDGGVTLPAGTAANSVAVRADGLGAAAIESPTKTDAGWLVFFDANSNNPATAVLGAVEVGALPDMVSFSPDGTTAVVANEGEPSEDFSIDPEGSVSVVALPATVSAPVQSAVATANFHAFEAGGTKTLHDDVRVFGPTPHGDDLPVSRNLEPEYVAIDADSALGYVALQEANAVAVVDLATAEITEIWPLGFQDHGLEGNGIDASDRDPEDASTINIQTYEGLKGMYMPDGINAYTATDAGTGADETYLVTANEGDAREWGDYVEGTRAKSLEKDDFLPVCETSPLFDKLGDGDMGRLNVSGENGLNEAGTCYEELYSFGSRSFSIWDTDGTQLFDSGDDFEQITAAANPEWFNSNHSESNLEGRSEDKGPEPENMAIGEVDGRTYAFIGLERVGGVMVYDISDPTAAVFSTYINNRNFDISMEQSVKDETDEKDLPLAGDLGPEGLAFISATDSPTGTPMLAVGNEVSGTTSIFSIASVIPPTVDIQVLGINDFHGRIEENKNNQEAGAAILAGAVAQLTRENKNTAFVSAGDNIGASTFTSFSQQDEPTIDALLAAGLDASVVGNHEFDMGWNDLDGRVTDSFGDPRYALGANVYDKGTKNPALQEYWITEMDGVNVGFIGTVTEQTASMVSPDGIADIDFGDQLEAANRVATQLSDGDADNGEADVIVLLTHEGSAKTDPASAVDARASSAEFCATIENEDTLFGELVRDAHPSINAILSAHTHSTYDCSFAVDAQAVERAVLQGGQYGMNLDQVTFTVDTSDNSVTAVDGNVLKLHDGTTGNYPADPDVAALVADAASAATVVGSQEVGAISADIARADGGVDRGSESSLSNLLADIQLWATSNDTYGGEKKAEIGIMNPGGVRADLIYGENGTVTYKDVASVQPFANTLVTVGLTGAQLKSVLEEQWQPDGSSRAKLHLGLSEGFSYVYDEAAARGERIIEMSLNGATVDSDRVYTVVTNSFIAAGGDNFTTFRSGIDTTDTGQADLAATVAYFEAFDVVEPAEIGRATLADVDPGTDPAPATVTLGSTTVTAGQPITVTVDGLDAGQQITATLNSTPVDLGTFTANSSGNAFFSVTIPANTAAGAHTLVISANGLTSISAALTVVAVVPDTDTDTDTDTEIGTGTDWADVTLGAGVIRAGQPLAVTVDGLTAGQQVTATLNSIPVHLGDFTANAAGVAKFTVTIPLDTAVGAHHIVISTTGRADIRIPVTITASAVGSTTELTTAGFELAPSALAAGLLLLLGGALLIARRRRGAATAT
ncbi:bifunctional metallophosphatase/5'-nucleotidase [Cryobacterium melibiosiphilum]|uniref:Bifunctional metallophosphatase/5'-nucleotidase n=1 Tax=Cryobacterium melibiosiphilum TaxID=995039 RepID=A0A3A5MCS1_9MICO|nr:choice-of-anchor I family protein [Cryobacterium melibiosiphilum]RJT87930.1 bifunctional metallophosphatase/5'-nucleotidase [Cryobacterium melibiosiphilum]